MKLSDILFLWLSSCSSASVLDASRRPHPDGVSSDFLTILPKSEPSAETSQTVAVLEAPVDFRVGFELVQKLFQSIVTEDTRSFDELFSPDATILTSSMGSSTSPRSFFEDRFRKLDYRKLGPESVYQESRIRILRAVAPATRLRGGRARNVEDSDLVLSVPISRTKLGAERLFGDEVQLWLRRNGDGYRIYMLQEDFQVQ